MKRIISFLKTSVLGGLTVVLPLAILASAFKWMYGFITNIIQPFTNIVLAKSAINETIADAIVVGIIVMICFTLGILIKTSLGKFFYNLLDKGILLRIPGYSLVKETVLQFIGNKKSLFSSVALVNIFCNDTMVTAFVTDEHPDGSKSVFVPTGPNPTSGNIYHVKGEYVHPVDIPVEDAMRTIIGCGIGSGIIVRQIAQETNK